MATRPVRGFALWRPALSVFVLLNLLDVVTTWIAMDLGMREGNLLPSLLLAAAGPSALLGFKVASVLVVVGTMLNLGGSLPGLWRGLKVANFLLGLIVLANCLQLLIR